MTTVDTTETPHQTTDPNVLVVDDERTVLDALSRTLREAGFHVRAVTTVVDALREADRKPPDVILLDFHLAGASGLPLLRCVRTDDVLRHTPVAMLTGDYLIPQEVVDELRRCRVALLFKPIQPLDLVGAVQSLLREPR